MYARMQSRRTVLATVAAAGLVASVAGLASRPAMAQGQPVKIGELNSYSRMAAFAVPYRNGMQLAQDEINAKGGVLGGAQAGDRVPRRRRHAGRCRARRRGTADARERLLPGRHLPLQRRPGGRRLRQPEEGAVPRHRAADRRHHHGAGNKYTYRVRPSTYMQTKMLVEAVKAKGVKKWAIVAPNYEYGQSAAANFKKLIKVATPDAEIVGEQFPALGKIDAGATVAALENTEARRHLQRAVRRRPHRVRARGQHARPVREAHRGEPADRRARVHHPARRGDAGGLDRHRLSLGADHRRPTHKAFIDAYRPSSTTRRGSARCSATSSAT